MNKDSASGFGIGVLAGVVIGAALGLIFAPKTGRETREIIGEKTSEVVAKGKHAISRVRGNGKVEKEEEIPEEV